MGAPNLSRIRGVQPQDAAWHGASLDACRLEGAEVAAAATQDAAGGAQ